MAVAVTCHALRGALSADAPAAVTNAIDDALRPPGAAPLTDMPFTPEKIPRALGKM